MMKAVVVYMFFFIIAMVLTSWNFSFAAEDENELDLNFDLLKSINAAGVQSMDTQEILKGLKFNLPLNLNKININTNIPVSPRANTSQDLLDIHLRQFLTPKNVSSDDLVGVIKAVATLVIEIFLVVISITSQILKLILEFLR